MFEVIIALFIITLVIVAIVFLSTNAVRNSNFSKKKTEATKYTQEAVEWLRKEKEKDASIFINNVSTSTYCLNTLSFANTGSCGSSEYITNTDLLREAEFLVTTVSNKTIIDVIITTSWNDAKGYHETRSSTYFTDTRE